MDALRLTRHADVLAILSDTRFDVVVAPAGETGIGWLRATVARFSTGTAHARRRGYAMAALRGIEPGRLRSRARHLAASHPSGRGGGWLSALPVTVLAEELGLARAPVEEVAALSGSYFDGRTPEGEDAQPLSRLVELIGGYDEATAARIGLLMQAHAATGALIRNALDAVGSHPVPVEAVVLETLRYAPPVPLMRRQCVVATPDWTVDSIVELDLAAANRDPSVFADPDTFRPGRSAAEAQLTFGAGLRPCPGRDHALAIAAGAIEGVLSHD